MLMISREKVLTLCHSLQNGGCTVSFTVSLSHIVEVEIHKKGATPDFIRQTKASRECNEMYSLASDYYGG